MSPAENAPRRILIVLLGALGDVVRGLAVVAPLKRYWPESHVTWLVETPWRPLVECHSEIDSVHVFERARGVVGAVKLIRELRAAHFDLTLDMQRHLKSGLCSWFSGAPRRIGFHRSNAKEGNHFFNTETIAEQERQYPKVLHYMEFLSHLGIPWEEPLDFGLRGARDLSPGRYDQFFRSEFAGIVLGSSSPLKDWSEERYEELIKRLLEESSLQVVLLGDRRQSERGARLANRVEPKRILNLAGKTTLVELLVWLEQARICISPDSGAAHIAAAVGTPVITLFGVTEPRRVGPYGNLDLVVQAPESLWSGEGSRKNQALAAMAGISVEMVWDKVAFELSGERAS